MKKVFALVLSVILLAAALAGCKGKSTAKNDVDVITTNGKIVIGISDNKPMNYKDKGSDQWIGFDAELAAAAAEKLGVKAEFKIIDMNNKFIELNTRSVDCIWDGITIRDEVEKEASVTNAYASNSQVAVVKSSLASKIKTVDNLKSQKELTVAVVTNSSGENVAKENGFNYISVGSQSDALACVNSGEVKAAIIDSPSAAALVGKGTNFKSLAATVVLSEEQYGVVCRKGSDLPKRLNSILEQLKDDGTMKALSDEYGVELIEN